MAGPLGIYIHFPWCLAKCPYCDFVAFAAEPRTIDHAGYADAVIAELEARLDVEDTSSHELTSVFFGGGTPSLWAPEELGRVLSRVLAAFGAARSSVEISIECDPSSLDEDRASALVDVGVVRFSIGVQGLDDARLAFLGRVHTAEQAREAIRAAVRAGVPRISADLIYGVAGQTPQTARGEAQAIAALGATHVSAYSLTIEPRTRFGQLARRGRLPLAAEGAVTDAFFAIDEGLRGVGFEHYEVSNYAAPGQRSIHNQGYWQGHDYLGLGCGAVGALRSRDGGAVRYRNRADPRRYVRAALATPSDLPGLAAEIEPLTPETRLRERIMLGLRLAGGIDLSEAGAALGLAPWSAERLRAIDRLTKKGRLVRDGDIVRIPREAWVWADDTAAALF
jgi:putative oxygen-independent coproporphyrinogen III oxidase